MGSRGLEVGEVEPVLRWGVLEVLGVGEAVAVGSSVSGVSTTASLTSLVPEEQSGHSVSARCSIWSRVVIASV